MDKIEKEIFEIDLSQEFYKEKLEKDLNVKSELNNFRTIKI